MAPLANLVLAFSLSIAAAQKGGNITEKVCSDYLCRDGCVPVVNYANNTCHQHPFLPGYMAKAYCVPISSGLCFQMHEYLINATTNCSMATPSSTRDIWGEGCDVCKAAPKRPGTWSLATGCDNSSNLTFHRSCNDSTCSHCNDTILVPINTCHRVSSTSAYMATGPYPCRNQIIYTEYHGSDCNSTPTFRDRMYDAGCFSRNGHAQTYQCPTPS